MRIKAINFKDKIIENCYNYTMVSLRIPNNWINLTLKKQQEWFDKTKVFLAQSNCLEICIAVQYTGEDELDEYEQLQLISKIAELTISEEDTKMNYLSVPSWFKQHIFCSVDIQKKLGNFKNKFAKLQIELYNNDEILERLVE